MFTRWRIAWRDQYPQSNVTLGGRVLSVSNRKAVATMVFPQGVDQRDMERQFVRELKRRVKELSK